MSIKQKLRVLVVDDMAASRGAIVNALKTMGIENVFDETDVDAAMSYMLINSVHIVVADYNMPGKDGLELLGSLRANKQFSKTGFILISGAADTEVLTRGRQLGMNNFVPKPFTPDKLQKSLEAVVGKLN